MTTALYQISRTRRKNRQRHAVQLGAARRLASITFLTVHQHCSCNQPPSAALNRRVHFCTLNAIRDFLQGDCKEQQNRVQFSCKPIGRHEIAPAAVKRQSGVSYWHTCTRGATSAEDCQRSGTADSVKQQREQRPAK